MRRGHLPNKVLRSDDAGGNGVSESVELNRLVSLKILLSEENVEVWVLFHGDVNLV